MNRESLPLIAALLIPIILVLLFVFYYYGLIDNLTKFFSGINVLYLIALIPVILGLLIAIVKWLRPN